MKSFTMKALSAAVVAASAFMGSGANAVNLNPDGLGEVLVYPYYTARGGAVTLMSIVNTTDRAKAVKVRFVEGQNTTEVLDFNLWLSAKDVWTGAIIANSAGTAGRLVSADKSCTNPRIPAAGVDFRNTAYASDFSTTVGSEFDNRSLDRTLEGYIQVIEMAEVLPGTETEADVTHDAGVPECDLVSNASVLAQATDYGVTTGGLFGNGTIVGNNMSTGYSATAFQGFAYTGRVTASGNNLPDLTSGSNTTSVVVNSSLPGVTQVFVSDFFGTLPSAIVNAMSSTIMHSAAMGEYTYGDAFSTDWVVTMPTKRPYVNRATALEPFQRVWNGRTSCVDVGLVSYDREEQSGSTLDDFSPSTSPVPRICYEANVISIGTTSGVSSVLASKNVAHWPAFQSSVAGGGWGEINFVRAATTPATPLAVLTTSTATTTTITTSSSVPVVTGPVTGPVTFNGLPTIGFSIVAAKYANASSNYNSSYNLAFRRSITGSQ
jgi:hypothetical protein